MAMTTLLSICLLFSENAFAQDDQFSIKCVVSDEYGPAVGVNVYEKNTTNGTTTDSDGIAVIDGVGEESIIVFSFIGYTTQEIKVGKRSVLNVTMSPDRLLLEETVVVGYGTEKKVNLTGSISQVDFNEALLSKPLTNTSSSLFGLMAGVQANQSSGQPGADNANIYIRGIGTLNNNSPLILIDGVEGPIDAVNPADIESISILKDAAASSIYGVRAGNGVVLVTTKRAEKNKISVTYNGSVALTQPVNLIGLVTDYADYMEFFNEAQANSNILVPQYNQETIDLWREKASDPNGVNEIGVPNYVAYPNTDWQRVLFRNSYVQSHSISVNAGGEKTRMLLSANYVDNPGLVENTGIKRYNIRANAEADIAKWLTLGTKIYASQDDYEMGNFGSANSYLIQTNPGVYPRWNNLYGAPEAMEENPMSNNLLEKLNNTDGTKRSSRINATLFSNIRFLPNLTWEFRFNYNRRFDEQLYWPQRGGAYRFSTGEEARAPMALSDMTVNTYNFTNNAYTLENVLRYNVTIAKDHNLGILAGYQEYYYQQSSLSTEKRGLASEFATVPSAATTLVSTEGTKSDNSSRSWFGRINYSYKEKYLFEGNLRYDGTSKFHKSRRWGLFPSAALAWRISEEGFMKNSDDWLDNLKLRVSYGQLGNSAASGNYDYQSNYDFTVGYSLNNIEQIAINAAKIANIDMGWERTNVLNIGLDFAAFNNRLNFQADAYERITKGILYVPTLIPSMGNKAPASVNLADVQNRGVEFTLGWRDNIKDFHYSISANVSYNKNLVLKYQGRLQQGWVTDEEGNREWVSNLSDVSNGSTTRVLEGYEMHAYYLMPLYEGDGSHFNPDGSVNINGGPADGMIRTEADMEWLQAMIDAGYQFSPGNEIGKNNIWYGDYIYADSNGDMIYGNAYDNKFINRSTTPRVNYGLQISMEYKGFDLYMNWAGAAGFMLYWGPSGGYNTSSMTHGFGLSSDIAYNHYFYDPENPSDIRTNINGKYERLTVGTAGTQNNVASTRFLHKGDFLKLKNLVIGYTVPVRRIANVRIPKIRVYLSGDNLLLFTKFPGQDPELGAYPTYSSVRSFSLGLNVTF